MKFAAIDIGSNAVRLYIARPLEELPNTEFKSVEFTRLPLRLGDDVFKDQEISKKKSELLIKSIQAFQLLMEIYNVDQVRACATSAMRDAKNGRRLTKEIKKATGLTIEILSGKQESKLIQKAILHKTDPRKNYLHIDVGGGSTELAFIQQGRVKCFESFNIGTVRLRENKVKAEEWSRVHRWLDSLQWSNPSHDRHAIGTGGNIVKLGQLSGTSAGEPINHLLLEHTVHSVKSLTHKQRVYDLKLNPDRAEVIDFAGIIYSDILKHCHIQDIAAPNLGLKDGIIRSLWLPYLKDLKSQS